MRGSPILSTIFAILIMTGAYLWLDITLNESAPAADHAAQRQDSNQDTFLRNGPHSQEMTACYIEAHFSTPPSKLTISDPATGRVITSESNLSDNEWSDEIMLALSDGGDIADSTELNIRAVWELDTGDDRSQQNFIQLILSPDQMEDSKVTLRNSGEIDTTAIFQLRK